ncbi:Glycerol-3-phosphate dehydrogenase [NAD(+)], partial [Paramicrosporidium saccamoebae]
FYIGLTLLGRPNFFPSGRGITSVDTGYLAVANLYSRKRMADYSLLLDSAYQTSVSQNSLSMIKSHDTYYPRLVNDLQRQQGIKFTITSITPSLFQNIARPKLSQLDELKMSYDFPDGNVDTSFKEFEFCDINSRRRVGGDVTGVWQWGWSEYVLLDLATVGENVARLHGADSKLWDSRVNMWVFEEIIHGQKLSEIINIDAVKDATLLIFVVPHQFVSALCQQMKGHVHPGARAISLIKGLDCDATGIELVSAGITKTLSMDTSVLMGANIAIDIAQKRFSEATIGYRKRSNAIVWKEIFEMPYFKISLVEDVTGVELCGALKNIIAVAAGFIDGLYPDGGADNTKAAVIRRGLLEMRSFCQLVDDNVKDATFLESCGIADVVTSSFGGRNRKVAEAFVRTGQSIDQLEAELLNGQKLQGPPTAREVYKWIHERDLLDRFPVVTAVYRICYEGLDPGQFLANI